MSYIEPIKVENLERNKIHEMLSECEKYNIPGELFLRILAHVPGYAENLFDAMKRSLYSGNVSHKLKELIRIQLAYISGDRYSQSLRSQIAQKEGLNEDDIESACGDFQYSERFSEEEKWALSYSYLMYREPKKIDGKFYERGKIYFSEAQIMEVGSFIALHYGLQVFMRTLDLSSI